MDPAPRVVMSDRHHRVAVAGDTVFALFRAGPTESRIVDGWDRAMSDFGRGGRKALFFGVVEEESVPPGDDTRKAFTRFFERHSGSIEVCVVAVEGSGFRVALGRTIVTGVMHLMPRFRFPFPRHVCS